MTKNDRFVNIIYNKVPPTATYVCLYVCNKHKRYWTGEWIFTNKQCSIRKGIIRVGFIKARRNMTMISKNVEIAKTNWKLSSKCCVIPMNSIIKIMYCRNVFLLQDYTESWSSVVSPTCRASRVRLALRLKMEHWSSFPITLLTLFPVHTFLFISSIYLPS